MLHFIEINALAYGWITAVVKQSHISRQQVWSHLPACSLRCTENIAGWSEWERDYDKNNRRERWLACGGSQQFEAILLHHENRFKKIVKGVSVDTRFFFRSRAILGVTWCCGTQSRCCLCASVCVIWLESWMPWDTSASFCVYRHPRFADETLAVLIWRQWWWMNMPLIEGTSLKTFLCSQLSWLVQINRRYEMPFYHHTDLYFLH